MLKIDLFLLIRQRWLGHISIVALNHGFIHDTSQEDLGVTETALTHYYQVRYIETIRVFPQNDH